MTSGSSSSHERRSARRSWDGPTAPVRRDYAPAGTGAKPGIFGLLKRLITEFSEDNLSDWAAALTYYGLMSLFPALIALVSIVGLFANPQTTAKTINTGSKTYSG